MALWGPRGERERRWGTHESRLQAIWAGAVQEPRRALSVATRTLSAFTRTPPGPLGQARPRNAGWRSADPACPALDRWIERRATTSFPLCADRPTAGLESRVVCNTPLESVARPGLRSESSAAQCCWAPSSRCGKNRSWRRGSTSRIPHPVHRARRRALKNPAHRSRQSSARPRRR